MTNWNIAKNNLIRRVAARLNPYTWDDLSEPEQLKELHRITPIVLATLDEVLESETPKSKEI